MIFQKFSQNKYKRKKENRCHITLKPLKGGRANGFKNSRSLNNRFYGLWRKSGFGPKLRESEKTFSFFEDRKLLVGQIYSSPHSARDSTGPTHINGPRSILLVRRPRATMTGNGCHTTRSRGATGRTAVSEFEY